MRKWEAPKPKKFVIEGPKRQIDVPRYRPLTVYVVAERRICGPRLGVWRDVAVFTTLAAARRWIRLYGHINADYRIDKEETQ